MKKLLILLVLVLGSYEGVFAQLPRDIPTIEALISGHKTKWKALQKRNQNEVVNLGLATQVSSLSEDYDKLRDLSFKRIESTYTALAFTKDAVEVASLLIDIGKVLPKFVDLAIKANIKYPLLYKYYMNTYTGVKTEIDSLIKLFQYGWAWDATVKERFDQMMSIKASLEIIKTLIDKTLWMGEGIVELGSDAGVSWMDIVKQEGLDKKGAKIAKDIFNKYKTGFK